MRLGIHYHVPMEIRNGKLYTSGLFGVFLDSVANEVEELICFLYTPDKAEFKQMEYELTSANVKFVDLGPHNALYFRLLRLPNTRRIIKKNKHLIDKMLVRAPTPIVETFAKVFGYNNTTLLLVGDYQEGIPTLNKSLIKNWLIKNWILYFSRKLNVLIKNTNVLSNSVHLQRKFAHLNPKIRIVKTTTLSADSFFIRENTCLNPTIKLLYTGRIDIGKGLLEMVEATAYLRKKGIDVTLSIVGWEDDVSLKATNQINNLAREKEIEKFVLFLGRKKVGEELNEVYRNHDIYLLCSQLTEGFPRTIWEAMANCIPVIATRVGSIPDYLNHEENAILIEPKNVLILSTAIENVINMPELRKRLIKNAYQVAETNTLEKQAKLLVGYCKENNIENK